MKEWPIKKAEINFSDKSFLKSPYYNDAVFQVLLPIGTIDDKGCLTVKSNSLTEIITAIQYHDHFGEITSVIVDLDIVEPPKDHLELAINFGIFLREFDKPIIVRTNNIGSYNQRLEYYLRYARRPQDSAILPDYNYPLPKYKQNIDWLAVASKATNMIKENKKNNFKL